MGRGVTAPKLLSGTELRNAVSAMGTRFVVVPKRVCEMAEQKRTATKVRANLDCFM
jgi:hypothetical protein